MVTFPHTPYSTEVPLSFWDSHEAISRKWEAWGGGGWEEALLWELASGVY